MIPNDDVTALYALADRAVDVFLTTTPGSRVGEADLRQEGVTWLLEHPGRAWVRAVDGHMEDPEAQLVADMAAHMARVSDTIR